jgi:hypothetical protein
MTSVLDLLSQIADRARVPRCSRCGEPGTLLGEDVVPGTPPVLESVYRCPRCGVDTVRCLVASALD